MAFNDRIRLVAVLIIKLADSWTRGGTGGLNSNLGDKVIYFFTHGHKNAIKHKNS
jgi:hypothetical protein